MADFPTVASFASRAGQKDLDAELGIAHGDPLQPRLSVVLTKLVLTQYCLSDEGVPATEL